MVLAYVIVSASFSSVASCSFYNLENYKESETKTIGRPPSVCVLILKSECQSVGFTDEIQMNIFLKVVRYSFSGPVPPKFEHKLRRHNKVLEKLLPQLY